MTKLGLAEIWPRTPSASSRTANGDVAAAGPGAWCTIQRCGAPDEPTMASISGPLPAADDLPPAQSHTLLLVTTSIRCNHPRKKGKKNQSLACCCGKGRAGDGPVSALLPRTAPSAPLSPRHGRCAQPAVITRCCGGGSSLKLSCKMKQTAEAIKEFRGNSSAHGLSDEVPFRRALFDSSLSFFHHGDNLFPVNCRFLTPAIKRRATARSRKNQRQSLMLPMLAFRCGPPSRHMRGPFSSL